MIRCKWLILAVLVSLLVAIVSPPAQSDVPGLNLLIFGQLELRRAGWSQYRIASAVTELFTDDLVRGVSGSSARVLCANWQFQTISPQGTVDMSQVCPAPSRPVIRRNTGNLIPPRGGTDPLIPFLITPRRTALLDPTPVLRWNRAPNANHYLVSLRDPSGIIWQQNVEGTETTYPGTPALKPAIHYALVIQADTGTSSLDEEIPGLAFSLLEPEQVQQIEDAIAQLQRESQDEEERLIAQAYLYRSNNLLSDAIALLETPTARDSRNPLMHRLLGDLYRQVRLNLCARNGYERAIALSTAPESLEELAQAQAALGDVFLMLRNREDAIPAFRQARLAYATLEGENSDRVRQLDEQLTELAP